MQKYILHSLLQNGCKCTILANRIRRNPAEQEMTALQKNVGKQLKSYAIVAALAVVMALSYELFVFPNSFAPAGINGIATMVQYLFELNIGYFSLMVNVPLLILAWFMVGHEYVCKNATFILVFSAASLVLGELDLSAFVYHTDTGTSAILGPVTAGIISGTIYGFVIRQGGATGGTDIVAACIRCRRPEFSLMWMIFALNASVALISYFVYDYQFEPVILCLLYCYLSSRISDGILKGGQRALKFEVVTEHAEELSQYLLRELHHGVTVIPAYGMYSGHTKQLLICVVNRHQIVAFHNALSLFPDTFAYITEVNETVGNFKKVSNTRSPLGKR